MAEILSLAASVVALIQLVNGLKKTVSKYINTVEATHKVLVPLPGRLCSLSSILGTLDTQARTSSTKSLALQCLDDPLRECRAVLEIVKSRLDNPKIVAGCVIGPPARQADHKANEKSRGLATHLTVGFECG